MSTLPILLALTSVFLLGSSRIRISIRLVAAQGALLGLAFLLHNANHLSPEVWTIGLTGVVLKGLVLPWLLAFVLRRSKAKLEVEPFVGFGASLLIGVLLLGVSAYVAWTVAASSVRQVIPPPLFAAALYLLLTGMFLIITRRKAITQTIGYLVVENGVFAMGLGIGHEFPFTVEMGVMLDIFVGVFLMGIMVFRIDKAFDHTDTDRFNELLDEYPEDIASGECEEVE
jgi:hydrogenase-4 component E